MYCAAWPICGSLRPGEYGPGFDCLFDCCCLNMEKETRTFQAGNIIWTVSAFPNGTHELSHTKVKFLPQGVTLPNGVHESVQVQLREFLADYAGRLQESFGV